MSVSPADLIGYTAWDALSDHTSAMGKTALPVVPVDWRRCITLVARFLAGGRRPPLLPIGETVSQEMDMTKVNNSSTLS
jgi:hypothetical protein